MRVIDAFQRFTNFKNFWYWQIGGSLILQYNGWNFQGGWKLRKLMKHFIKPRIKDIGKLMQRSLIAHADLSFQNARYIPTDSEAERNGQRDNQQGWKQKPYEKTRLERVHRIFQMNYLSDYTYIMATFSHGGMSLSSWKPKKCKIDNSRGWQSSKMSIMLMRIVSLTHLIEYWKREFAHWNFARFVRWYFQRSLWPSEERRIVPWKRSCPSSCRWWS